METFIVMYRNDYDEDVIQSTHNDEQEAIASLPRHMAAWGWGTDSRALKYFHIEVWDGSYVRDVVLPSKLS